MQKKRIGKTNENILTLSNGKLRSTDVGQTDDVIVLDVNKGRLESRNMLAAV